MMVSGWIKLHRASLAHPVFKSPLIWHYWTYCLIKANHSQKKIIFNKQVVDIERGSFVTGRKEAAKETGLTEQNIRTALLTLHNLGMVKKSTTKSTSKYTYLTICNYDKYQDQNLEANRPANQQVTSNQPASNQQSTTTKNEKNEKNEKKLTLDRFEKFWELYPRKTAKPKAKESFSKIKPSEELFNQIIKAVEAQKKTNDWTREGGKFIPYPATWLNQERWLDEKTQIKVDYSIPEEW